VKEIALSKRQEYLEAVNHALKDMGLSGLRDYHKYCQVWIRVSSYFQSLLLGKETFSRQKEIVISIRKWLVHNDNASNEAHLIFGRDL
jgi:hypothetical protein